MTTTSEPTRTSDGIRGGRLRRRLDQRPGAGCASEVADVLTGSDGVCIIVVTMAEADWLLGDDRLPWGADTLRPRTLTDATRAARAEGYAAGKAAERAAANVEQSKDGNPTKPVEP